MSSLFINKYKPYYLDDFMLEPRMRSVLHTLFEIDDLNLLFIGNQNAGKTTLLYALIREYYGLHKNSPIPETNILFINNLKEQGINYFRNEMKTFCQSHSSVFGKKKLIVVDDMDMINEQSQQVFRNYIDKYHHNVNFIAVCSNIQKINESIQSRIHILRMTSPSSEVIRQLLNRIVETEGMVVEESAKDYLVMIANGSIRQIINFLEKLYVLNAPIVTTDLCKHQCCNISVQSFEKYVSALREGNQVVAIRILLDIYDFGYSIIDILDYLSIFIKTTDMLTDQEKYAIIPLFCKYITYFYSLHENPIELTLFSQEVTDVFSKKNTENV